MQRNALGVTAAIASKSRIRESEGNVGCSRDRHRGHDPLAETGGPSDAVRQGSNAESWIWVANATKRQACDRLESLADNLSLA
jgi:hypothetical protein